MSDGSIRIAVFNRGGRRTPGIGGHVGVFHLARVREGGGRVISVGYLRFDRRDLQPLRDKGARLRVTSIGVLRLGDDVGPALAEAVLDARVLGRVVGDPRTVAVMQDGRAGARRASSQEGRGADG